MLTLGYHCNLSCTYSTVKYLMKNVPWDPDTWNRKRKEENLDKLALFWTNNDRFALSHYWAAKGVETVKQLQWVDPAKHAVYGAHSSAGPTMWCCFSSIKKNFLSCFPFLAIMNNAAVNILIQVFVLTCVFNSFGSKPVYHDTTLCVTCWGATRLFCKAV